MIQRLVPNARVGIGHGQMEGSWKIDVGFHERRI
jgi:transcription-repair coupling factor (superfamily II helicase)